MIAAPYTIASPTISTPTRAGHLLQLMTPHRYIVTQHAVWFLLQLKKKSTTLIEKPDKLPSERIVDKTFVDTDVKLFNNVGCCCC